VKKLLTMLLLVMGSAQAQTLTFTADTTTGTESVTPILTWSTAPPADTCVATGSWSGAKPPAGTETLAPITSSQTYNMTCVWPDGMATLTWVAPTENTDGTPLTDLAGFKIYQGNAPGDRAGAIYDIPDPALTSFVAEPLAEGSYCFVTTAYNAITVESDESNEVCKDVADEVISRSVGISVNPKPNAPSSMTIQ